MSTAQEEPPRVAFLDGPVKAGDDPASRFALLAENTREKFVAVEEVKMLRDDVAACYRRAGVNHQQECKELVEKYRKRIHGQFPNWGALQRAQDGSTVGGPPA